MKREYYVESINTHDVVRIEEKIYELFRDTILDFKKLFSSYNCEIRTIRCWTTDRSESATTIRPTLDSKYVFWISYEVLYNGKPIVYDDENSPLARSYCVLVISKKIKRHKQIFVIKIFDDTKDVIEELEEDLSKIKRMLSNQS